VSDTRKADRPPIIAGVAVTDSGSDPSGTVSSA